MKRPLRPCFVPHLWATAFCIITLGGVHIFDFAFSDTSTGLSIFLRVFQVSSQLWSFSRSETSFLAFVYRRSRVSPFFHGLLVPATATFSNSKRSDCCFGRTVLKTLPCSAFRGRQNWHAGSGSHSARFFFAYYTFCHLLVNIHTQFQIKQLIIVAPLIMLELGSQRSISSYLKASSSILVHSDTTAIAR